MQRANHLTILICATLVIAGLPLTGCVTKSKADAMAKQAFIAGERRGALLQSESHVVWVVGNVRQPVVPWTEDLTLAKAIVTADYLGNRDPSLIDSLPQRPAAGCRSRPNESSRVSICRFAGWRSD